MKVMKYKQQTRDGMKPEQATWYNTRKDHDDEHLDYGKNMKLQLRYK
jgi:hypothetical protein